MFFAWSATRSMALLIVTRWTRASVLSGFSFASWTSVSSGLLVEPVDLEVVRDDLAGEHAVALDERVLHLVEDAARGVGHLRDLRLLQQVRAAGDEGGVLGEVLRVVADPFEVGVHLHGRDDEAEIDGDGRVEREDALALVVDLEFERVHLVVALADALGEVEVARAEGVDGVGELLVDDVGHLDEEVPEELQLIVQGAMGLHKFGVALACGSGRCARGRPVHRVHRVRGKVSAAAAPAGIISRSGR